MLELLITLLLAVHLLAVNVGSVGPLACVALRRRARSGGFQPPKDGGETPPLREADRVGRRLAGLSAALLAVGAVLGLALLGVLYLAGDQAYFEAAAQLPLHRYGFALIEFAVALGLLVAYRLLWDRWRDRPVAHGLLAAFASANLLFHFPPLLTIIAVVGTRPELRGVMIESDLYRQLLFDGEVLSRVLHVWLASAAVTGVAVAVLGVEQLEIADWKFRIFNYQSSISPPDSDASGVISWGGRLALFATLAQLPLGLWVTLALPEPARRALLGEDPLAGMLLAGGVLAALLLLHQLAALAMGDVSRAAVRRAALLMLLVVLLMSAALRSARVGEGATFQEGETPDEPRHKEALRLGGSLALPAAALNSKGTPS
jgi:hypothetical protein